MDEKSAKLERLAILPKARGQGIGKKIMQKALEVAAQNRVSSAVIHAQEYIKELYQKLGFVEEGDRFIEGGIVHVKMRKQLNA